MANLIFEGQLKKKGKINKSWKNRWCIISEIAGAVYLQYYDSKIESNLMGSIDFSDVYDIKMLHSSDYDLSFLGSIPTNISLTNEIRSEQKYTFIIYTAKRKWIFSAFDPKNFNKWMIVFDKYIYNGIIKRGWLQKRGEKNRSWKRRFFILNKYKQLKYYTDNTCKKWLGTISINDVIKIKNHKDKGYTFHLVTDKRIWILCSATAEDRRQWTECLNACRKKQIHHKTFSLIDDVKEAFNWENINKESLQLGSMSQQNTLEHEGDKKFEEEWRCASCQQVYATMWTKCPGCLRSNTHYVYYINQ
eukprot:491602_1